MFHQTFLLLFFSSLLGVNSWTTPPVVPRSSSTSTALSMVPPRPSSNNNNNKGLSKRELEIRQTISKLKQQGKLKKKTTQDYELEDDEDEDGLSTDYESRIRQKLGPVKSQLLGYTAEKDDNDSSEQQEEEEEQVETGIPAEETTSTTATSSSDDQDEEEDMDLLEIVAQKMAEKRRLEQAAREQAEQERFQQLKRDREQERLENEQRQQQQAMQSNGQITSGVGGTWTKPADASSSEQQEADLYQPKTGSWGAFPRPKDISKAYGGGRRVGSGFQNEDEKRQSEEDTRARLQRYREKVGIDVQSEKDHAETIEAALQIGSSAMQRGLYSTAVSALEKVTKYCSTNSPVGGKVFLELAMAYEASGQTQQAITVYRALSKSRMEEIKYTAKRLLYGIEALDFMQNDVKSEAFNRKQAKTTFIDTTGLANIASNFDDVYNTAYVDLEGGFYKRLTESVVRSTREARQILLRATDAGEVGRLRVVQALRSLSRNFDDALQNEIQQKAMEETEPVAVIDGKPIAPVNTLSNDLAQLGNNDEFLLADAETMLENLDGEWRLQLLADKKGDGVKYFNSSLSWQTVDTSDMKFASSAPSGFLTFEQEGSISFNEKKRILRRTDVQAAGAAGNPGNLLLSTLLGGIKGSQRSKGATGAVNSPQQVITVDSVLLITRGVPNKLRRSQSADDDKDYFAVWRRVERGTFSSGSNRRDKQEASASSASSR